MKNKNKCSAIHYSPYTLHPTLKVSEAMAWHCQATIAASHLTVDKVGLILGCPGTLDQIAIETAELGVMSIDLAVRSDSHWTSSNGCYGTLKCIEGPCEDGQETLMERTSRCGRQMVYVYIYIYIYIIYIYIYIIYIYIYISYNIIYMTCTL
jgi:hypothetical protein